VIAAAVAVGQVLIVTFGGAVFKVEPLGPLAWLAVIAGTSSVLAFAEAARRLRLARRGPGPTPLEQGVVEAPAPQP
jgi:Ca2+-transporting ATPase